MSGRNVRETKTASPESHVPLVSTPSSVSRRTATPKKGKCDYGTEESCSLSDSMGEEKIQDLNSLLATFIDKVRFKDASSVSVRNEYSSTETRLLKELDTVRGTCDEELQRTRMALDDEALACTRYKIENQKKERDNIELRLELDLAHTEISNTDHRIAALETKMSASGVALNRAEKEKKRQNTEIKKLKKQLDESKNLLEEETTTRVDLQNRLQTADETFQYQAKAMKKSLIESSKKVTETTTVLNEDDDDYDHRLEGYLMEMRNLTDEQRESYRYKLTQEYTSKIAELQDHLQSARYDVTNSGQKLLALNKKIAEFEMKNAELTSSNDHLLIRCDQMRENHGNELEALQLELVKKDAVIAAAEKQISALTQQLHEMTESNINRDKEIEIFRIMLESECERIGISPRTVNGSQTKSGGGFSRRGAKRRRTGEVISFSTHHTSTGDMLIEPIDMSGKFISVTNTGNEAVNIGGWVLANKTGSEEESMYKFYRSTNIDAGETCKVWTSDAEEEHSPPLNLVMKKGSWKFSDDNVTTLVNKDGVEVACRKSNRDNSFVERCRQFNPSSSSRSCVVM